MPGRMRVGRTLAYWSKPWQIFRRRPQSVMWSGMCGSPAEPNRIASLSAQRVEPVRRHHHAVLAEVVAAPVEVLELEAEGRARRGQRLQHLPAGGNDFLADAVSGNGGDAIGLHACLLAVSFNEWCGETVGARVALPPGLPGEPVLNLSSRMGGGTRVSHSICAMRSRLVVPGAAEGHAGRDHHGLAGGGEAAPAAPLRLASSVISAHARPPRGTAPDSRPRRAPGGARWRGAASCR